MLLTCHSHKLKALKHIAQLLNSYRTLPCEIAGVVSQDERKSFEISPAIRFPDLPGTRDYTMQAALFIVGGWRRGRRSASIVSPAARGLARQMVYFWVIFPGQEPLLLLLLLSAAISLASLGLNLEREVAAATGQASGKTPAPPLQRCL